MNRLMRNSAWLVLGRLGAHGGMALFTILVARALGRAGFGEYAFMAALIGAANVLTTFGTDMLLIREIAARNDLSGLGPALVLQIGLSAVFICAVYAVTPFSSFPGIPALRMYSLSLLPQAFFTTCTTALRGRQLMGPYTLLHLALAAFQLAAALIVYFEGGDLLLLAMLLLISQFLGALLAGFLSFVRIKGLAPSLRPSMIGILQLMRASASMAVLGGLGILYQRLNLILMPFLLGAAQTGVFSSAARVVEAGRLGHVAVFTAMYPMMSESITRGKDGLDWLKRPWSALIAAALLGGLATFFLARPLVLGLFGVEYLDAVPVLQIIAWVLVPYTINTFLSLALLAEGRESSVVAAWTISVLLLALTTVWWGRLAGPVGAACAVLATEAVQSILLAIPRLRRAYTVRQGAIHEFPDLSRKT